jgi:hypothetical protein
MSGYDVPVVLIVFNRPDHTALVFDAVRAARPSTLLIVADGPRADHPDDAARCRAVRGIVERVDWPCTVLRDASEDNLGCDRRIATGLDWAFSEVDRAIVLEDDTVPDASFFPWCAAMLDRYADTPDIMQVSGRNELGRSGRPGADHLVVRRGSILGWATWATAWRRADPTLPIAHDREATVRRLDELALDPLVRTHLERHLAAAAAGTLGAWDCTWWAAMVLAGGWSVVSPVNLVRNSGFGPEATRTANPDDLRGSLPVGVAPPPGVTGRPAPDPDYDRRALLVELMATYTEPELVARLARARRVLVDAEGVPDADALHHLAPFDQIDESVAAIAHLRAAGMENAQLDRVEAALGHVAGQGSRS